MRGVFSLNERDRSSDPGYISGASNYLNRSADLYTSKKFSRQVSGHPHTTM